MCLWAAEEGRPAREVDRRPHARPSWPTRTAATTSRTPSWRSTPTARSWRCGSRPRPTWAPICRPSPRRCRPISTRRCCRASTTSRPSTARSTASTPTPRPVDAYRGAGRPEATFVVERLVEVAARETGQDPAEFRRQNFITTLPAPDAGHHDLRRRRLRRPASTRRWRWPTTRASPRARRRAPRRASCAASASPPTSRPAASRPSAAVGSLGAGVGLWESAEVRVNPDRHGRGADRLAQPRPGPRDHLRPARRRSGSASRSSRSRSCTATPTRCSSAWAPTARAPARSACRRSSRPSTR